MQSNVSYNHNEYPILEFLFHPKQKIKKGYIPFFFYIFNTFSTLTTKQLLVDFLIILKYIGVMSKKDIFSRNHMTENEYVINIAKQILNEHQHAFDVLGKI